MPVKKLLVVVCIATAILSPFAARTQNNNSIVVQVNKPVAEIQPTMWGVFSRHAKGDAVGFFQCFVGDMRVSGGRGKYIAPSARC